MKGKGGNDNTYLITLHYVPSKNLKIEAILHLWMAKYTWFILTVINSKNETKVKSSKIILVRVR